MARAKTKAIPKPPKLPTWPTRVAPAARARSAALEQAVRASRTDRGAVSVYADWLQSTGQPEGELIAIMQASHKTPASKKRRTALAVEIGLPLNDLATFGWRDGVFGWLRLENVRDWMDDKFDAVALAEPLFASPLCVALDELRLGVLRWERNELDVPAVIAAAAGHAWAKALPSLHLGDVDDNVDMAHHVIGVVGTAITKAFPNLRRLKLHSGDASWSGPRTFEVEGLALPALETLIVETCAMSKKRLTHLLAAKLPKLTELELWFGDPGYGGDAKAKQLAPLLAGEVHKKVTRLGLRNTSFTDELAGMLGASRIAGRLTHLDLSMGTLGAEGVAALVASRRAYKALATLSIDDNFLSTAEVRAVRAAFAGVQLIAKSQKEPDTSIPGESSRFVSVHE